MSETMRGELELDSGDGRARKRKSPKVAQHCFLISFLFGTYRTVTCCSSVPCLFTIAGYERIKSSKAALARCRKYGWFSIDRSYRSLQCNLYNHLNSSLS